MALNINTQTDLNNALSTIVFNGNVTINDLLSPTDKITTLEWPALVSVSGTLQISVSLLTNLTDSFPNLVNVGNIQISDNPSLVTIDETAFPKVVSTQINVSSNNALLSINGFQTVEVVDGLVIQDNPLLTNLSGFCALQASTNTITISNNDSLTNLDPFCHLTFLDDSAEIQVQNNAILDRFCGLRPLSETTDESQWVLSNNAPGSPTSLIQVSQLDPCVPEWVEPLPADLIRYICGSTGTDSPSDTGIPEALYFKTLDYKDLVQVDGCITTTTRTWTAEGFCGSEIEFVQTIIDERACPLTIVCPDDYTVTCSDTNLCPSTTGSPSVQGALPGAYEVTYLDFVFKRDLKTCKPLIIKRRWSVTSDCPDENSVVYCVQTICVPRGWPHFTTCGFTPGQFCGLG